MTFCIICYRLTLPNKLFRGTQSKFCGKHYVHKVSLSIKHLINETQMWIKQFVLIYRLPSFGSSCLMFFLKTQLDSFSINKLLL